MLNIPDDLLASSVFPSVELPQASLTEYRAEPELNATQVLVTRPALVLVLSGIKQLDASGAVSPLRAVSGNLIAFRSGAHVMSEFRMNEDGYQSLVFTVDRTFLRSVIGMPQERTSEGPRAVVATLSPETQDRLLQVPENLRNHPTSVEREFHLRAFIVAAMSDAGVRALLYREVADWGTTTDERVSSVVSQHCLSPLRVEDLATLSGMSLASFKRHFCRIYQISPGQWLQQTRLSHAHGLTLNSQLPIKEISAASGYRDPAIFSRAFRRFFGASPTAVRQQDVIRM